MKTSHAPLLTLGLILLAALTIFLGAAQIRSHKLTQRLFHKLETIPLRDDYRKEYVIALPEPVTGPVRLLNDSLLIYCSEENLIIRSFRDSSAVRSLHGHTGTICDFDIARDGKRIVSASSDGTIRLWDAHTGAALAVSKPLDTLDQPDWTMLMDVTFTRNGRRILTADMQGIKEWRARNCRLLRAEVPDLFYLRWGLVAPDGKSCCAPRIQGGNEIMDRNGKTLLYCKESDDILGYSPDGSSLLFAPAEKGPMYRLNIRRLLRNDGSIGLTPFIGADATMQCAAFSPDGKQVVSADAAGKVYVWNAWEGCLRETLTTGETNLLYVDFDRQGYWILAADPQSGRVHIWAPYTWVY